MNKLTNIKHHNIAIFRALQIGDWLCAIPAVRALKKAYPNSHITLIGLSWSKNFVQRFNNYFDDFIQFPGYPGLPEQPFSPEKYLEFLKEMQKRKFDLIFQMQGNGSIVNAMLATCGAENLTGFCEEGRYTPNKDLFMPYPEEGSEISRHLKLMNFLGIPSQGESLEFPLLPHEEENIKNIYVKYNLQPQKYVCVHSGARDTKRWWNPENFAHVADLLANKGLQIVLTGTQIEEDTVQAVAQAMKTTPINLVGQTDLGTFAALIKNARMLLSNDTGASHIAASVQTPSVVIFLASDPKRWAPLNTQLHHIILPNQSNDLNFVITNTEEVLAHTAAQATAHNQ